MSTAIITALIGAGATIFAGLIAWAASATLQKGASLKYRRDLRLPDPLGRWKCDWFKADGSLYVSDEVNVESWVKDGRFRGKGIQPTLSYTLEGEIDGTRVMALTYRTEDFPTKAYVGVACLLFSMDGDGLSGHWYGRARDGEFMGGVTKWRRKLAT